MSSSHQMLHYLICVSHVRDLTSQILIFERVLQILEDNSTKKKKVSQKYCIRMTKKVQSS